MFCLRSWIPILFFLLRTNASPIYLILFISATYFLNRPCVYCSLLLFILVVALFDFHTAWFEPPLAPEPDASSSPFNGTSMRDYVFDSAISAANTTSQAVAEAVQGARRQGWGPAAGVSSEAAGAGYEWARGLLGKKEWKISCLDVLIRI